MMGAVQRSQYSDVRVSAQVPVSDSVVHKGLSREHHLTCDLNVCVSMFVELGAVSLLPESL